MAFVYILTNKPLGTLYTGFTNNLSARIEQHQEKLVDGFTKQHGLQMLVWYEMHESVIDARARERAIKKWRRDWKINLIQSMNPNWVDLSGTL